MEIIELKYSQAMAQLQRATDAIFEITARLEEANRKIVDLEAKLKAKEEVDVN